MSIDANIMDARANLYAYMDRQAALGNEAALAYLANYPNPNTYTAEIQAIACMTYAVVRDTSLGFAVVLCGQQEPCYFTDMQDAINYMLADARSCVGMWMA